MSQIYIVEVKGNRANDLGDLSKDISQDLENIMLPVGCWIYVHRIKSQEDNKNDRTK
jgi:hypothetical protein